MLAAAVEGGRRGQRVGAQLKRELCAPSMGAGVEVTPTTN